MPQHEVEVKDGNGTTAALEVTLPFIGDGTWHVKSHRFLRLQKGVVDRGAGDPGSSGEWIACYGGREVTDKLLVLHLDDFFSAAGVNDSGTGHLYDHDNLLMVPGPLTWRLLGTLPLEQGG